MYVDDIGAASINDLLFDHRGDRVMLARGGVDGAACQQRRASLHFDAAVGVIKHFDHANSEGKSWHPGERMDFLGATLDLNREALYLTELKRDSYASAIVALVGGETASKVELRVGADELNSLCHKLLHAASTIILGRAHTFYILRALRAKTRLTGGRKVLGQRAQGELLWWLARLRADPPESCPLASSSAFARQGAPGLLVYYSDASRELDSPGESGYGGWLIIGDTFVYFDGRWTDDKVRDLHINELELATMNFAAFTFLAYAASISFIVTHLLEFTDNEAAEFATDRGKSRAPGMHELVRQGNDDLLRLGVTAASTRVSSVDNDVADGLSGGGERLQDALRIAREAGLPLLRLQVPPNWRDLAAVVEVSQRGGGFPVETLLGARGGSSRLRSSTASGGKHGGSDGETSSETAAEAVAIGVAATAETVVARLLVRHR